MGRKIYSLIIVLFVFSTSAFAQSGEIKGKVIEKSGEAIPFASVAAMQNGSPVVSTAADIDGKYTLKPLPPGKYDVKVTNVGYQPGQVSGVIVSIDNISFVDITLTKGVELEVIDVTYVRPLIEAGSPAQQKTMDYDEIQALPTRDVNSAAVQSVGVYQKETGGELNIRGARSDATAYYIDGVKVPGGANPGKNATEQITVITGGIPAQYGDATGGIINVTTRGPSSEYGGSVELATSELLDQFGYNLASLTATGPIYRERKDGKKTDKSLAGFFISAEYQYDKDPSPTTIPVYKVKPELLSDVQEHPLALAPGGGYIHRSSYFTYDSLTTQKERENVALGTFRLSGKFDVRPAKNFTITLGGSYEKAKDNEYSEIYTLMNYANNPEKTATKWRAFAKLTQLFGGSENKDGASSAIKNAYYNIQVDYTNSEEVVQSEKHKTNFFDYGYVGKFQTYARPTFSDVFSFDTVNLTSHIVRTQDGNRDTLVIFTPGTQNPLTTNYTEQYYELTQSLAIEDNRDNLENIAGKGGLINGDNRVNLNTYGLWGTTGRVPNGYDIRKVAQGRISASGSADIKNHNIVLGLEFEKRTAKRFFVSPSSLWDRMRGLANQQLKDVEPSTGDTLVLTDVNGNSLTEITYGKGHYEPSKNKENENTRGFYENVRDRFNIGYSDTVQIDSYDPSQFSLNLFTADELLNDGNPLISYYGYDYTGEESSSSSWSLKDFYVDKDENNNNIRKVDAFRPIYMAGYIQDKFTFNDIIFNVGVRVDRFDANQKVLKDPYSLYDTYKAGSEEAKSLDPTYKIPDNIKEDYVVYVNSVQSPSQIVGYRDGNVWYDKTGTVVTDLQSLRPNGEIQPFIKSYSDYQNTRVNPDAFADYEPQVNVMPRIAFSFPISDEAYFAAHYDVLTQRPQSSDYSRFNPISYLFWSQKHSGTFSNPDLKPEKTTVYEINFQQKLTETSAFSITTFYKEMKNNIQEVAYWDAFPIKYSSFGNVDFGTVKGLTFGYDLRRTSNIRLNLSYTLSFADGTGSDEISSSGIISQQGQTNLREVSPLAFDQRHTFVTSIDFHYAEGKNYDGPVWFNKQVFANAGLNVVMQAGSGAPYTRKSNFTPEADFETSDNSRKVISGTINGSRLPWNFKMDAKLDKSFLINNGMKKDGVTHRTPISMNVYLQVLNILNTQNTVTVYKATGSPDDDGYLNSPGAQGKINGLASPQSYRDLYAVKINDPQNYDVPRRIHLGVQINF